MAALTILLATAPAIADDFDPWHYEDIAEAKGSWSIDQSQGTQFSITGSVRDLKPGDDPVYWLAITQASSGVCLNINPQGFSTSCSQDFFTFNEVRGEDFNSPDWSEYSTLSPVSPTARSHRVIMRVCENRRFEPDGCSEPAFGHEVWNVGQ